MLLLQFLVSKSPSYNKEELKQNQITGGHESNEMYTYVRGRGKYTIIII